NENDYEVDIDLPGFKKDEIKLELTDGYLTVSAAKGLNEDEKEEKTGRWIRQERYVGAMQRSFYVGDALTEEDIKASFKDGVLALTVPKKTAKLPEKKTILIEG
ncbi:MAG: Hsp20/alpha crystallin family protein, partial [Firmicutes bacterium]|nr:Hsp20/alpha crystallin family protein [Bacillota bacterium]